jgi:putative intracellular protease/amidase
MKKILMILASENFRDIEYIVPRAFFEQAGHKVFTASSAPESKGRFGFVVKNDFTVDQVNPGDFDGIFYVGGNGSLEYIENDTAKNLAENFYGDHKAVGAICAAPRNFLHWGLLKGKKATGHNGDGQFVPLAKEKGAEPKADQTVVIDGGILTGNGPEAAEESALKFMELLN